MEKRDARMLRRPAADIKSLAASVALSENIYRSEANGDDCSTKPVSKE